MKFDGLSKFTPAELQEPVLDDLDAVLNTLTTHYRNTYKSAEREKEALIASMTATPALRKSYFELLDHQRNESLADHVTNKNDVNVIAESGGELVQKSDPIYVEPREGGFFAAHFYAPVKRIFGDSVQTPWANIGFIWVMTALLALALKWNFFPWLVERVSTKPWERTP